MTPHRIGKTGSYRFDRVFPGVGRINRSSGTTSLKEFRRRDLVLTELYEHAQLDALRAFQRGDVTIEQLVEAKRAGRVTSAGLLADVKLAGNLWETLDALFPAVPRSQRTLHRYRTSVEAFARKAGEALGKRATVADLARVDWSALRARWGSSSADWNHLRRMLSTGLTKLLGDVYHPFRREVMQRIPLATETARTPDLSPELFWRIVDAAPAHVRAAYVTLIVTGMRVGEYLACTEADLRPHTSAIEVPGTKTAASRATIYVDDSFWPWIVDAIPCRVRYQWLRRYWLRACIGAGAGRMVGTGRFHTVIEEGAAGEPPKPVQREIARYQGLRLHDLRHAYAQLASDAGAPTARIQAALRHAGPEMTRRYEMQKARREVAQLVAGAMKRRA